MRQAILVLPIALSAVAAVSAVSAGPWSKPLAGAVTSIQPDQRYRGFVLPSREVELIAPLEEIIRRIDVVEGDRVKKGQVLAGMDDQLQEVVVEAAQVRADSEADVRRATIELEDAKLNEEHVSTAFERKAASDLEMRRARIAVALAEAGHTAALETRKLAGVNLRLEQRRLGRYQIRAPFDGTIIEIMTEAGAMLTDEDDILRLANLDTLEAQVNLPIELYGQLEVGATYTMHAEHPVNGDVHGRLEYVNPIIDTASRTFLCVFAIENEKGRLPAGFTVYLAWPQSQARPASRGD